MTDITLKVRALDKLLDYVASGVGAIAGPLLAPWKVSREGKARVIMAKADAEVQQIQAAAEISTSQLIANAQIEARGYVATSDDLDPDGLGRIRPDDVQKAMEFQPKKRMINIKAIAGHAAEELQDTEVPNKDPDPDWTARFFDGAQDVSSEELQKLWGRILAGEIKSPGQTSLRTISILRNMTQKEVKDFSTLMRLRIDNFIVFEPFKKRFPENFNKWLIHFSGIGLLSSISGYSLSLNLEKDWKISKWVHVTSPPAPHKGSTIMGTAYMPTETHRLIAELLKPRLTNNGIWFTKHHDYLLIIKGEPGQKFVTGGEALITPTGLGKPWEIGC